MAAFGGWRALFGRSRVVRRAPTTLARRYAATAATAMADIPAELYAQDVPPPAQTPARRQVIHDAKPFSEFLTDTFQRQHDYLRISLTERCNLRCLYCMPEEGVELSPNKDLLTSAEILYLCALFVNQGVNKIRLTGGEPTVRKDIIPLMQQIGALRRNGLKELALTTNGISLHRKLDAMVEAGLTGVNISLDTLDPFQFQLLTRRQGFEAVMKSINRVQEMNKLGAGIKLKINAVAMRGLNDHQILPFVEKTRDEDIEVRFIEYMPFGGNKWSQNKMLPYSEMLELIRQKYPTIARLEDARNDTSKTWQVPGFKGRIGFITSMTHNFCGTCNRLRITSDGNLKVCLHGNTEVSLRDLLRDGNNGDPMDEAAFEAVRQIELDRRRDGKLQFDGDEGWLTKEQQLLEVIGAAVKRKKARHAGMGELENMQNRPMILIGEPRPSSFSAAHRLSTVTSSCGSRTTFVRPFVPLHVLPAPLMHAQQVRWSSSRSSSGQPSSGDEDLSKSLQKVLTNAGPLSLQHEDAASPVPAVEKTQRALGTEKDTSAAPGARDLGIGRAWRIRKQPSRIKWSVERSSHLQKRQSGTEITSKTDDHAGTELTHINQAGAANMVNVGRKDATRRVAIATSVVSFSNPETFDLVQKNENKKGDVLSVARVAGIMAAKRTSELIPLCHPINITKADVDLRLVQWSPAAQADDVAQPVSGAVHITTKVECTGQTGVEMEAMTAAMGAALTVYDMCKATDRDMVIRHARLLYKSGGKSGIFVHRKWMRRMGREYFVQHGLELPSDASFSVNPPTRATTDVHLAKQATNDVQLEPSQPMELQTKEIEEKALQPNESARPEIKEE